MTFAEVTAPDVVQFRDVQEQSLRRVLAIYGSAVPRTTAVWSAGLVDLAKRRLWLRDREAQGFQVIVAMIQGGREREQGRQLRESHPWASYRLTVEHSVYGDEAWRIWCCGRSSPASAGSASA